MLRLFGRLLRWLLRTVVIVVLLFVIAAVIDFYKHRIQPGSVLVLKLRGDVVERAHPGLLGVVAGEETPLNDVRRAIRRATKDPRIVGLAIEDHYPNLQFAQAQELAGLIHAFAGSGKWTAAYAESSEQLDYLVASAAREVSLMPRGWVSMPGVVMPEFFARGALDWLGVTPDMQAIGIYKSAINLYTEKDYTTAQREEDNDLTDDLYQQLLSGIGDQRHLSTAAVKALIDHGPLDASAALSAHLFDRLEYQDEFRERIKHYGGPRHPLVNYADYVEPRLIPNLPARDKIAVIYGLGEISEDTREVRGDSMRSEEMAKAFKAAREDDAVRAVIFRVDSPGGSPLTAEVIRRQVELTVRKKPVVVSMSGVAASGGYWVAASGSKIFADPGSLTGSIGVFGGKFNFAPMLAKAGVNVSFVSRGQNAAMDLPFTDFTPDQQKILHDQLSEIYQQFVNLVSQGRHLTVEQVDGIAQGRVWSGKRAQSLRLIDSLGDFDAALDEAKVEAKMTVTTPVQILEMPTPPGLLQQLMGKSSDADSLPVGLLIRLLAALSGVHPSTVILNGVGGVKNLVPRSLRPCAEALALYCPRLPLM